jgi:hypothetical protein
MVQGTLKGTTSTPHATITGAGWTGILVATGGTLTLDSVDVVGAMVGVGTQSGTMSATLTNCKLTTVAAPFLVDTGSKLTVTHVSVTGGSSMVKGDFVAAFLDYDKGTSEGITTYDANATMTISDSNLHGGGGGDYVVSSAGNLVHVEYSTISGSRCPFHFDQVTTSYVDHVTAKNNAYGAMYYQADVGPHTLTNSNFEQNAVHDVDQTSAAAQILIGGTYFADHNNVFLSPMVTGTQASAPIASAAPRGTPGSN